MFRQASLLASLALISCAKGDITDTSTPQDQQTAHGKVAGIVTDSTGLPLVGVLVSVQGTSVSSNDDGVSIIPDVQPSPQVLVSFTKSG